MLLDPAHPLFPAGAYAAAPPAPRRPRLGFDPSLNLSRDRCLARMAELLAGRRPAWVLVVGSGGQRERLAAALAAHPDVRLLALDVDVTADVDVFADAHEIPFAGGAFDAVVTTAVLEHVADPERVMAEIHRVLRPGGVLYSEIPFMQQVHEGAYDFTRFTLVGHLRLARGFTALDSGAVAGPATGLAWSVEHLLLALAGGRARLRPLIKAAVRLLMWPVMQLDRVIAQRPAALDAASCTYVLGLRREDGEQAGDAEIVAAYAGAQRLDHLSGSR